MQRRLVNNPADEERRAVFFRRDAKLPKLVRPLATKMTLDSDQVDHAPVRSAV
jgi:hypothetical protein